MPHRSAPSLPRATGEGGEPESERSFGDGGCSSKDLFDVGRLSTCVSGYYTSLPIRVNRIVVSGCRDRASIRRERRPCVNLIAWDPTSSLIVLLSALPHR